MYKVTIEQSTLEWALRTYCSNNANCHKCPLSGGKCIYGVIMALKHYGEEEILKMFRGIIEKEEDK